jgi:hypothetical protein
MLKIKNDILTNRDYTACYTCYKPLIIGEYCWFVVSSKYLPLKEGTSRLHDYTQYAVCCSEECVTIAFLSVA